MWPLWISERSILFADHVKQWRGHWEAGVSDDFIRKEMLVLFLLECLSVIF